VLLPGVLLLLLPLAASLTLLPLRARCLALTPLLRKLVLLEAALPKLGGLGWPVVHQVETVLLQADKDKVK
jgi:hypothetical protein